MKIKTEIIERPKEFDFEKNDCFVRAIQRRIKTSYNRAHELMSKHRRLKGRTKPFSAIASVGLEFKPFNASLKQLIMKKKTGCYLVCTRTHAFVVDQGKVYDDGREIGLNTRILFVA